MNRVVYWVFTTRLKYSSINCDRVYTGLSIQVEIRFSKNGLLKKLIILEMSGVTHNIILTLIWPTKLTVT